MEWYKVEFRNDPEGEESVRSAFQALLVGSGGQPDIALFESSFPNENIYYLSPLAASLVPVLIARHGGVSCPRPDRDEVRLVMGNADAADRLL